MSGYNLVPVSSLSQEKDPGWVWSRGTQILGGDKQNKCGRCA